MPMYEYKCPEGHKFVKFSKISEYRAAALCDCGKEASRVLSAPMVRGDLPGYGCPVTGKWVEGRRAHEENLKRTGCRVLEPGEREAAATRRSQADAALETSIETTAAQFVEALPVRKREKLAAEIDNGAAAVIERL